MIEVRFSMCLLRAFLEVSSALSHPLVTGYKAKENLSGNSG